MKITIKNIKGETFQLDVHQSETVLSIIFCSLIIVFERLKDFGGKEQNQNPEKHRLRHPKTYLERTDCAR